MRIYDEVRFRSQVDRAVSSIRTVLDNTKRPQYPSDVQHTYDDKYWMVEMLTNTALASQAATFELLGLDKAKLAELKKFSLDRSVTLRLKAQECCVFDRQVERVEESASYVTERTGVFGNSTTTEKVLTKVVDYFWKFSVEYELFAFRGNDINEKVVLTGRSGSVELKTSANITPQPQNTNINITWLLQNVDADSQKIHFSIDRSVKACHTPRRNPEVESAIDYFSRFYIWCDQVKNYFRSHLWPIHPNSRAFPFSSINALNILVPVVPLFIENKKNLLPSTVAGDTKKTLVTVSTATESASPVLQERDVNDMLAEQARASRERMQEMQRNFPKGENDIVSAADANIVVLAELCQSISQQYYDGVEHVEDMLRTQLIAAIGREISAVDFNEYMTFHNRRLFKRNYRLAPFSYSVRFEDKAVEGTISIEARQADGENAQPIFTCVRGTKAHTPMKFALDASTKVSFFGERYVHAWVCNQFAGNNGLSSLNLVSRARQFSCFIVMVGRILSADLFEPKFAAIVRNKDDLKIPLELETIPTPKEFADAIASLSPEQQRFAKAFRAMKLSSTLFGVVVIQIKPQLEKLLNLPYGSLIKEMALTQRLLDLFIQYQIPSDLLSYDGPRNIRLFRKIEAVRENVEKIEAMIDATKDEQLSLRLQEMEYGALARQDASVLHVRGRGAIPFFPSGGEGGDGSADEVEESPCEEEPCCRLVAGEGGDGSADEVEDAPCEEEPCCGLAAYMDCGEMEEELQEKCDMEEAPQKQRKRKAYSAFKKKMLSASPESESIEVVEIPKLPDPAILATQEKEREFEEARRLDQEENEKLKQQQLQSQGQELPSDISVEEDDLTKVPGKLDKKYEELDEDNALRPTIINPGKTWMKSSQTSLLSNPTTSTLANKEQEEEKKRAMDLLDALSRSGSLAVDYASLHVVVAATHCFAETLMNTVVKDNINPIEKVERSSLIMATTIHQKPTVELIKADQLERVRTYSPKLFEPSFLIEDDSNST